MSYSVTALGNPGTAASILLSMRPKQWVKNLFVFAPLVFSQSLFVPLLVLKSLIAFGAFCFLSGAVYLINDVVDRERDAQHPVKQLRPIASGLITPATAVFAALVFAGLTFVGSYLWLGLMTLAILVSYLLLNLAYSLLLKHVLLLDVLVIALGFVLRVSAGGHAIQVRLSSWLLVCTLLIALFLALCKRRYELVLLEGAASNHREILGQYSPHFLDQLIAIVAASTVISYALYSMSEDVRLALGSNSLKYTLPFVLYGLFRYLYLVHRKDVDEDPTEAMMTDVSMLVNMALWALTTGFLVYL